MTFYDSFCVVEKRATEVAPGLGSRVIAGTVADVDPQPLQLRKGR